MIQRDRIRISRKGHRASRFLQEFNRNIPPLFSPGGLLDRPRNHPRKFLPEDLRIQSLLLRVKEYATFGDQVPVNSWKRLFHELLPYVLEELFLQRRPITDAELTQLRWLNLAGHASWIKDIRPIPPPKKWMNWEEEVGE